MTREQAEYIRDLRTAEHTLRSVAESYKEKYGGPWKVDDNQLVGALLVSEAEETLGEPFELEIG